MPASVLETSDREALLRRVAALPREAPARWGRFTAPSMVCHLIESARMALGEIVPRPRGKRAFRSFPLKQLLIYVLPWPKGAPTAPELLAGTPGDFERDRETLGALVTRVGTGPREGVGPDHPLFGRMTRRDWGVLMHRHVDHHLKQFGA